MKKLPVVLNVVLLLAVAALYFIVFTGNKKVESGEMPAQISDVKSQGIAYVEIDSILYNFDMFKDLRNVLMDKQKSSEAQLNSKGQAYEKGARDYEEKVRKGLVTRATAAQMEQALMQQQQDLVALRDNLQMTLMEEEQVTNRQVLDYIYKFLEEYTVENNYQYILGKSFGSTILYSDPQLEITNEVLAGLNEKYLAEKKIKK